MSYFVCTFTFLLLIFLLTLEGHSTLSSKNRGSKNSKLQKEVPRANEQKIPQNHIVRSSPIHKIKKDRIDLVRPTNKFKKPSTEGLPNKKRIKRIKKKGSTVQNEKRIVHHKKKGNHNKPLMKAKRKEVKKVTGFKNRKPKIRHQLQKQKKKGKQRHQKSQQRKLKSYANSQTNSGTKVTSHKLENDVIKKDNNISALRDQKRIDDVSRMLKTVGEILPGSIQKIDFDKFIAKNQQMLDPRYWKRHFSFYDYNLNEGIREARKNIRKHGSNPNELSSKDLCHYFFDTKCYQRGENVCTEKDKNGDCKKWYHQPFRYDKSGKRELWMQKYWDSKPETYKEQKFNFEEEIKNLRYDSCIYQRNPREGILAVLKCVPVHKILEKYPDLARRIENLYSFANKQNFVDNAEAIVKGVIIAADQPDCQLFARMFPFLERHFEDFWEPC